MAVQTALSFSGVPEAAALQFDLAASRRAQRVRSVAQAGIAATVIACAAAFVQAPSLVRGAAALAAAVGLAGALRRQAVAPARRLGIAADGAVTVQDGNDSEAAATVYCGPHFICLCTAAGRLPVWPDTMSASAWRRLAVACRWPRGEGAGKRAVGTRTK